MGETAQSTVGGVQVLDLLHALARVGAETRRVCAAVRLEPDTLRNPDVRVPTPTVLGLLQEAECLTGDPLVGLHAGERAEPSGPLTYLVLSIPRLHDGIRRAHRFSRLILSSLQIRHEVQGDTVSIVYEADDPAPAERHHAVEYLLRSGLRSMQRAVGETLHPRAIHYRHADRGHGPATEHSFGCPVHFSQLDDRAIYGARDLQAASRFPNQYIAEQIEKFAAALEARVLPLPTFGEQLAAQTRAMLAAGMRADRVSVARRLGVSDRTLRRGLESESTAFRAVRDGVLREVAEALLSSPTLKVEAVALSMGFADVAAFSKAFKRWAGCSPTEFRTQLAAAARYVVA
jgi:AraC-like DNA-binding protein